jgi:hypothetical protein
VNLALGAVLLVILLIPPLIFIYFYGKGTHARGIPKMTLVEYLFLSAVLSLFLHSAAIRIFKLNIDYKFLVQFISGQFKPEDIEKYDAKCGQYFNGFALYTFLLTLFCATLGWGLSRIVISRRLRMLGWLQRLRGSRKPDELFCYFNTWWYYFRANEYDTAYSYLGGTPPLVYVDTLVDTSDASVLYCGVLHDFIIKGDDLHSIYLSNTIKRLFSQKDNLQIIRLKEGEEVKITPSGIFCIPYANIINLHIRFVSGIAVEDGDVEGREELTVKMLRTAKPKISNRQAAEP